MASTPVPDTHCPVTTELSLVITPSSTSPTETPSPNQGATLDETDIPYKGVRHLLSRIHREENVDSVGFRDVSWEDYSSVEKARDRKGRKFRIFYLADLKLLIVTLPTGPHEVLHRHLDRLVFVRLAGMGQGDQWISVGSKTFRSQNPGAPGGGEADSCGKPYLRPLAGNWPTLVIEAGDSQPLPRLQKRMGWWFRASNHEVKIVILVKLHRGRRQIILEKWQEVQSYSTSATNTREHTTGALRPDLRQRIEVEVLDGVTHTSPVWRVPASYRVTKNVPLRLEFDLLFASAAPLGQADPGPSPAQPGRG